MKKLLLLLLFITGTLYAQPPIAQPNDLIVCDDMSNDGFETFDLTINETQTLDGLNPANYTITYHLDQAGADANSNLALPPNSFVGGPNQTIYVRVEENANPTDYATTSFNLIVNSLPSAFFSPNPFVCSGESFDLGILGTPNATVQYTIDGGSVQSIVLDATGAATLSFANLTVTTLVSMVDVTTSTCTQPFPTYEVIQVLPTPNINQPNDMVIYENPFDGSATFDLTQNESVILNGINPSSLNVFYYGSLMDAQVGTNAFLNQSSYFNISNPETIFVRVEDIVTGCYSITNFDLVVSPDYIIFTDANFKAKLISLGYDSNVDGEIQYIEASNNFTQVIDLSFSNISNLEGFQYFPNVTNLICNNNQITSLNLTPNTNLTFVNCRNNLLTLLNVNSNSNLVHLLASDNQLTSINLSNHPNLENLWLFNNQLTSLNVDSCVGLKDFSIGNNLLTSINLSMNVLMDEFQCAQNQLTSLDLSTNINLLTLNCSLNNLTSLNVSQNQALQFLYCNNNNLTSLNVSQNSNLEWLYCYDNQLTSIDVVQNLVLKRLFCQNNQITTIDLTNKFNFNRLQCQNNQLISLFIKGINVWDSLIFDSNPNITYICTSDNYLTFVQDKVDAYGYSLTCLVNTYCSFVPSGNYNTISGIIQFDFNNNGCNALDAPASYLPLNLSFNAVSLNQSIYTNLLGNYSLFTNQTGTYELNPNLENPSYFNVTPNPATVNIPVIDNSTTTQNFCITANGVHPDLEIVIAPITPARPGFDAVYKIVYKNKGNQTLSGNLQFNYNDAVLDYISSSVLPISQSIGSLIWNYSNLNPFENRSVLVTLNVNSPQEIPAVNIDDVLNFSATINPVTGDETTADNAFAYNQTVVGSYDPNDITCIEGNVVSPSYIGQYLHYVINFENTGTYLAENIVVKTTINPADFDINTLRLLEASHNVTTRVNADIVEFIFQTINLDTGGHGNILLKIRTKDELVISDMVSKKADIYFDYNFPIETNFANTTFQVLSNSIVTIDNSVGIYPNPTNDIVKIKANSSINSVEIFDVQGRIIQKKITNVENETIDVSGLTNGIYFMMIKTEKGQKVEKLVKE